MVLRSVEATFGMQTRAPRVAPLAPVALGLAAGVWMDHGIGPGVMWYWGMIALSVLGLAVGRVRRRWGWVLTGLSAAALGGVLNDGAYRRVTPNHVMRFVGNDPIIARVRGTVMSQPRPATRRETFFERWMYRGPKTRFLLDVSGVRGRRGWIDAGGLVSVSVNGETYDVHAGDGIEAFGRLYRFRGVRNPGQFDYGAWQRRRGVHVGMSCKTGALVVVEEPGSDWWRATRGRLRRWASAMLNGIDADTRDETSGLLETMVLGRRGAVDRKVEKLFLRTGTSHFLAVSGAHLGIVAWFAWGVGRWLGGTRRACAGFVAILIVVYACVVDPRPPVLRAAIIGLTLCASMVLRRSTTSVNSLAFAAIVLLVVRPTALFDVGFQMSFAAMLGIIYLRRPLVRWFRWPVERRSADLESLYPTPVRSTGWRGGLLRGYRGLCEAGAVSTAACLVSTPIVASYFGRIAPLAWLWSMILFPFVALTLVSGVATVSVGWVTPLLWPAMRAVTHAAAGLLWWVVAGLDTVSPEFRGGWNVVFQIAYLCVVVALVGTVRVRGTTVGRWFRERVGWPFVPVTMGLVIALTAGWTAWTTASRGGSLRVTHLAVGRGTAAVVEFPDGRVWLYDCGTNGGYDVGTSVILPYCRVRGITRIDRVVISHPNLDHFSGLFSVMDAMPTGPVVMNDRFRRLSASGRPAEAMLGELARRGHPMETIERLRGGVDIGGVWVEALWPTDDPRGGEDTNDSSTVLRLGYGGRSVLMCGDVEEKAMAGLLDGGDLGADVLVLPHHGSRESHTAAFIDAVDPHVLIASSDRESGALIEGMTRAGDSDRARLMGRPVFSTGDAGAVMVVIDDATMTVHPFVSGVDGYAIRRGE